VWAMVESQRPPAANEADDELDMDLPPMDGDNDDEGGGAFDDEVPVGDEAECGLLDDTTGDADPIDAELEGLGGAEPRALLEDAEEAEGLDVGVPAFDDEGGESLLDDAESPEVMGDEIDASLEAEAVFVDTGDEGPEAEDEELREQDLPRLDADEDDEGMA